MAHSILYFGWLYLHCHKTDKLIISAFLQWFNFFLSFTSSWNEAQSPCYSESWSEGSQIHFYHVSIMKVKKWMVELTNIIYWNVVMYVTCSV